MTRVPSGQGVNLGVADLDEEGLLRCEQPRAFEGDPTSLRLILADASSGMAGRQSEASGKGWAVGRLVPVGLDKMEAREEGVGAAEGAYEAAAVRAADRTRHHLGSARGAAHRPSAFCGRQESVEGDGRSLATLMPLLYRLLRRCRRRRRLCRRHSLLCRGLIEGLGRRLLECLCLRSLAAGGLEGGAELDGNVSIDEARSLDAHPFGWVLAPQHTEGSPHIESLRGA